MRYCPKQVYSYTGNNNIVTTINYVTFEDVVSFHGTVFAEQWKKFIGNNIFYIKEKECYYYADYKHHAIATDMYIHSA